MEKAKKAATEEAIRNGTAVPENCAEQKITSDQFNKLQTALSYLLAGKSVNFDDVENFKFLKDIDPHLPSEIVTALKDWANKYGLMVFLGDSNANVSFNVDLDGVNNYQNIPVDRPVTTSNTTTSNTTSQINLPELYAACILKTPEANNMSAKEFTELYIDKEQKDANWHTIKNEKSELVGRFAVMAKDEASLINLQSSLGSQALDDISSQARTVDRSDLSNLLTNNPTDLMSINTVLGSNAITKPTYTTASTNSSRNINLNMIDGKDFLIYLGEDQNFKDKSSEYLQKFQRTNGKIAANFDDYTDIDNIPNVLSLFNWTEEEIKVLDPYGLKSQGSSIPPTDIFMGQEGIRISEVMVMPEQAYTFSGDATAYVPLSMTCSGERCNSPGYFYKPSSVQIPANIYIAEKQRPDVVPQKIQLSGTANELQGGIEVKCPENFPIEIRNPGGPYQVWVKMKVTAKPSLEASQLNNKNAVLSKAISNPDVVVTQWNSGQTGSISDIRKSTRIVPNSFSHSFALNAKLGYSNYEFTGEYGHLHGHWKKKHGVRYGYYEHRHPIWADVWHWNPYQPNTLQELFDYCKNLNPPIDLENDNNVVIVAQNQISPTCVLNSTMNLLGKGQNAEALARDVAVQYGTPGSDLKQRVNNMMGKMSTEAGAAYPFGTRVVEVAMYDEGAGENGKDELIGMFYCINTNGFAEDDVHLAKNAVPGLPDNDGTWKDEDNDYLWFYSVGVPAWLKYEELPSWLQIRTSEKDKNPHLQSSNDSEENFTNLCIFPRKECKLKFMFRLVDMADARFNMSIKAKEDEEDSPNYKVGVKSLTIGGTTYESGSKTDLSKFSQEHAIVGRPQWFTGDQVDVEIKEMVVTQQLYSTSLVDTYQGYFKSGGCASSTIKESQAPKTYNYLDPKDPVNLQLHKLPNSGDADPENPNIVTSISRGMRELIFFRNQRLENRVANECHAGEYVELFNGSSKPVSLDGWVLKVEQYKKMADGSYRLLGPENPYDTLINGSKYVHSEWHSRYITEYKYIKPDFDYLNKVIGGYDIGRPDYILLSGNLPSAGEGQSTLLPYAVIANGKMTAKDNGKTITLSYNSGFSPYVFNNSSDIALGSSSMVSQSSGGWEPGTVFFTYNYGYGSRMTEELLSSESEDDNYCLFIDQGGGYVQNCTLRKNPFRPSGGVSLPQEAKIPWEPWEPGENGYIDYETYNLVYGTFACASYTSTWCDAFKVVDDKATSFHDREFGVGFNLSASDYAIDPDVILKKLESETTNPFAGYYYATLTDDKSPDASGKMLVFRTEYIKWQELKEKITSAEEEEVVEGEEEGKEEIKEDINLRDIVDAYRSLMLPFFSDDDMENIKKEIVNQRTGTQKQELITQGKAKKDEGKALKEQGHLKQLACANPLLTPDERKTLWDKGQELIDAGRALIHEGEELLEKAEDLDDQDPTEDELSALVKQGNWKYNYFNSKNQIIEKINLMKKVWPSNIEVLLRFSKDHDPKYPGYKGSPSNPEGEGQYNKSETQFYVHFPWLSATTIPAAEVPVTSIDTEEGLFSLFENQRYSLIHAKDSLLGSVINTNSSIKIEDTTYNGVTYNFFPNGGEYKIFNNSANNDGNDIEDMAWAFIPVRFHVEREPKPISIENPAAVFNINTANIWNYLKESELNLIKTFNIPFTSQGINSVDPDSITFDREDYIRYHKSSGGNPLHFRDDADRIVLTLMTPKDEKVKISAGSSGNGLYPIKDVAGEIFTLPEGEGGFPSATSPSYTNAGAQFSQTYGKEEKHISFGLVSEREWLCGFDKVDDRKADIENLSENLPAEAYSIVDRAVLDKDVINKVYYKRYYDALNNYPASERKYESYEKDPTRDWWGNRSVALSTFFTNPLLLRKAVPGSIENPSPFSGSFNYSGRGSGRPGYPLYSQRIESDTSNYAGKSYSFLNLEKPGNISLDPYDPFADDATGNGNEILSAELIAQLSARYWEPHVEVFKAAPGPLYHNSNFILTACGSPGQGNYRFNHIEGSAEVDDHQNPHVDLNVNSLSLSKNITKWAEELKELEGTYQYKASGGVNKTGTYPFYNMQHKGFDRTTHRLTTFNSHECYIKDAPLSSISELCSVPAPGIEEARINDNPLLSNSYTNAFVDGLEGSLQYFTKLQKQKIFSGTSVDGSVLNLGVMTKLLFPDSSEAGVGKIGESLDSNPRVIQVSSIFDKTHWGISYLFKCVGEDKVFYPGKYRIYISGLDKNWNAFKSVIIIPSMSLFNALNTSSKIDPEIVKRAGGTYLDDIENIQVDDGKPLVPDKLVQLLPLAGGEFFNVDDSLEVTLVANPGTGESPSVLKTQFTDKNSVEELIPAVTQSMGFKKINIYLIPQDKVGNVNINTAPVETLLRIPGLQDAIDSGVTTLERTAANEVIRDILEAREGKHHTFTDAGDLLIYDFIEDDNSGDKEQRRIFPVTGEDTGVMATIGKTDDLEEQRCKFGQMKCKIYEKMLPHIQFAGSSFEIISLGQTLNPKTGKVASSAKVSLTVNLKSLITDISDKFVYDPWNVGTNLLEQATTAKTTTTNTTTGTT